MKFFDNLFICLVLLLSGTLPAQGVDKYGTPRGKQLKGILIECNDHKNFDSMDCYRALDAELEVENQALLADDQRSRFSVSGKKLLVERSTNLEVGSFVTEINGRKLRELQIFDNKVIYGFVLGAAEGCNESNFSVLENTPAFIFIVDSCFYQSKRGTPKSSHNYLVYSKKEKAVFTLIQSDTTDRSDPSLELHGDIYRFQWDYVLPDKKTVHIYYRFKIKSQNEAQCSRTWNDDCPISPLQKRIIGNG